MQLIDYLRGRDSDQREAFALACGTSLGHLRNIGYGYKPCSPELAIAIERESKRAVKVETLCPDVDWKVIRGTRAAKAA